MKNRPDRLAFRSLYNLHSFFFRFSSELSEFQNTERHSGHVNIKTSALLAQVRVESSFVLTQIQRQPPC